MRVHYQAVDGSFSHHVSGSLDELVEEIANQLGYCAPALGYLVSYDGVVTFRGVSGFVLDIPMAALAKLVNVHVALSGCNPEATC